MKNAIKILCMLVVVGCLAFAFLMPNDPAPAPAGPSEVEAVVIAQAKVKERLKSPESATFPNFDYQVADQGNGLYLVRGYVDAANDFGANKRINYVLQMHHEGGPWANAKNWKVVDLKME